MRYRSGFNFSNSSLVFMGIGSSIKNLWSGLRARIDRSTRSGAIIIGTDYPSYQAYRELQEEGKYEVMFFIDEEPWNHRTTIGDAQLRYPSELPALCENHNIEAIFYTDETLTKDLPATKVPLIKK